LISGFTVSGHAGYAECGRDIVCAAVSSAVQLVTCIISDEMKLKACAKVDCGVVEYDVCDYDKAQAVLKGLEAYLYEVKKDYPKNIDILEA